MKTLYVTDLDGTLLNSNEKLSKYTIETLNDLINKGMYFSYATARSLSSASVVTSGLTKNIPVIVYNGTFIINLNTKERIFSLFFDEKQKTIVMEYLNEYLLYPLVYGFVDNEEKVSWLKSKENNGIKQYINSRKGDARLRPIETKDELYYGEPFYFTCIDEKNKLMRLYDIFTKIPDFTCIL